MHGYADRSMKHGIPLALYTLGVLVQGLPSQEHTNDVGSLAVDISPLPAGLTADTDIEEIALRAGPVPGPKLDLLETLQAEQASALHPRHAKSAGIFRRTRDTTNFRTIYESVPADSMIWTGTSKITLNYDSQMAVPGCKFRADIIEDATCVGHPLPGWQMNSGSIQDTTADVLIADFVRKDSASLWTAVRLQILQLYNQVMQNSVGVLPAPLSHYTSLAGVAGSWSVLITVFPDTPGFSYTIRREGEQFEFPGPPSSNIKAIGAATLLVILTTLKIVAYELDHSMPVAIDTIDALYIKTLLYVLNDLMQHAINAIADSGGPRPTPTLADIRLGLKTLAAETNMSCC